MGVKTKAFGPVAWRFLESMAAELDHIYNTTPTTDKKKLFSIDLLTNDFFTLLAFVIPCVYCRISYTSFLETIDIQKRLKLQNTDKVRKIVFDIHNKVNNKLRDQELDNVKHDFDLMNTVSRKWDDFIPIDIKDLKDRFQDSNHPSFWINIIYFLSYVMCDFTCFSKTKQFFLIISDILSLVSNHNTLLDTKRYLQGIKKTEPLWNTSGKPGNIITLKERLLIVWTIQKYVFRKKKKKLMFQHAKSFMDFFEKDIVKSCSKVKFEK